jgi:hypothetical protein
MIDPVATPVNGLPPSGRPAKRLGGPPAPRVRLCPETAAGERFRVERHRCDLHLACADLDPPTNESGSSE